MEDPSCLSLMRLCSVTLLAAKLWVRATPYKCGPLPFTDMVHSQTWLLPLV